MPRKERSLFATHLVAAILVAPAFLPDEEPREFEVVQPPRIQLGDAPLNGFSGSETDQVEILWQNRRVGRPEASDEFVVAVRKAGDAAFVEVGPGRVLTGLIKRIDRRIPCYPVEDREGLEKLLALVRGDGVR